MSIFTRSIFAVMLASLASCASNDQEKQFTEIIEGFPEVKLPIDLNESGTKDDSYRTLLSDKARKFADEFNEKGNLTQLWGRIYPSDEFHYLIGSMHADAVIPVIFVFDKTGKQIDSKDVLATGYGVGPEGWGKSSAIVRGDKTFKRIDSTFYHTYIEEYDSIVPGSGICTAIVSDFKIQSDGKIEMTKSDSVRTSIPD